MSLPQLLLTGIDFEHFGNNTNLFFTASVLFVVLFVVEFITSLLIRYFLASDKILSNALVQRHLTRSLNEVAAMSIMAYLGYISYVDMGRLSALNNGVGVDNVMIYNYMSIILFFLI